MRRTAPVAFCAIALLFCSGCIRDSDLPVPLQPNGLCNLEVLAAFHAGDIPAIRALIARGARVDCKAQSTGPVQGHPLRIALTRARSDLLRLLLAEGVKVTGLDLYHAVHLGREDVLQILLDAGADPNLKSGLKTPLGTAFAEGNIAAVRILLDRGANPNAVWCSRYTGLLFWDLRLNCFWECNLTPLMVGAAAGAAEFVRVLLEKGADPHIRDGYGRTALDLARLHGREAIIAQLSALSPPSVNAPRTRRTTYVAPIRPVFPWEGEVLISVALAPDGRVADARVACAIPSFNEAALTAVRQWRYQPAGQEDLSYFLVRVPFWP